MRAMILGPPELEAIANLRAFAEAHPMGSAIVEKRLSGQIPPIGCDPRYRVEIPMGFACMFTVEEIALVGGGSDWCRHLSVSLTTGHPDVMPHPGAVRSLMPLFGIAAELEDCTVTVVEVAGQRPEVNIFSPPGEVSLCR